MEEIWKEIPSLPGWQASSLGRVLKPESCAEMPHGGTRSYKTKPTFGATASAKKGAKHTYKNITSKFGTKKVHALICEAFHGPKPTPKSVVIHINEDSEDNRSDNLRWGTQKENLNAPGFIQYCKSRTGANNPYLKGIEKRTGS